MTPTVFDLATGAVNLAADWSAYRDAIGTFPVFAFIQNTGETNVYVAARDTVPTTADTGHVLGPRESFDLTLPESGATDVWVWSPSGSGRFAVSER